MGQNWHSAALHGAQDRTLDGVLMSSKFWLYRRSKPVEMGFLEHKGHTRL